ncbi:MAG TPA: hypothetical protein VK130_09330 [Steroidobacteraceae bacterium]|nr:hypothetical protein [Steroidobacteraceae bacterium]
MGVRAGARLGAGTASATDSGAAWCRVFRLGLSRAAGSGVGAGAAAGLLSAAAALSAPGAVVEGAGAWLQD